ncbi:MAG: helix-turn-helix transcriptional regulator [Clostridia bacterium]|nr:helix-turn-helix transcriptional regulator [Clostridia bacterium]
MDEKLHEYLPGKPGDSRERIQDLLRENCMTQAELAEKTGMSESALSRYISGQTDKLSTENIVAIAKVFGVTTDFLLCLSDIPFTTNYDIEKLGLTVGAAEKLLKRKVDPLIVSQLIVSPPFALLVTQLARLRDDTYAAGFAYMTEMLRGMNDLFTEHVQSNPEDRQAAKKVMEDLRLLRAAPYQVQTEALHETLDKIVEDFKKGSDSYMQEMQKLTSKVMAKITSNLKAQMKNPEKLRSITPEMMVDSLIGAMDHLELNDEQKKQFRETLLPLFTKPQDMMRE